jgi:threonine/homoserine/homoserine lactone efflux protein
MRYAFPPYLKGPTMPSTDHLLAFLLATLIFAIIPGPGILYTAAQTLARGRLGGLMAALGIHLGGYLHVGAAALGLAALFQLVPLLYTAVKLAGALYLVILGIGIMRGGIAADALPSVARKSPRRAFVESIAVEAFNPKTALFYLAFLPQFVDPAAGAPLPLQFLALGIVVNIAFSLADLVAVLLTAALLLRLRRTQTAQRIARLVGGSIMIGLGLRLATARE